MQDSLRRLLNQPGITTIQRAELLAQLSANDVVINSRNGIEEAIEALQLGRQSRDAGCLSYVFSYTASTYARLDSMALVTRSVDSALFYAGKTNDKLVKGLAWYKKGWLQNMNNDIDSAVKSWQQALDFFGTLPDGARFRAGIYYLYFGIYAERGDIDKEEYYAQATLKESEDPSAADLRPIAWQINGTACLDRYDLRKDSALLDTALFNFKKAVSFPVQPSTRNITALSALYVAQIYMDHFPPWTKDSVIKYASVALSNTDTANNKRMLINCCTILGHYALQEGKTDQAEQMLQRAEITFTGLQPTDYFVGENLYKEMAALAEKQGNAAQALKYYKLYAEYFKKEFDARQFETTKRLEARYQAEKKEKEIRLLRQQDAFHRRQNYFYIGIIVVAALGLTFMFLAYHFRLRYFLQRGKLKEEEAARLALEKQEAELQSRLKEEEAARLQAEQQLLKAQQEQLQKEVMTGALQIEHKNELLQTLKEKLSTQQDITARQLGKILHEESRLDEDFEKVKSEFKDIHPEFFNRLQGKTTQKLTGLDLKYCAYIYLKLSSKQIASLLHVEPKSVRMARYRLKQKLGLSKEDSLDEYLNDMKD